MSNKNDKTYFSNDWFADNSFRRWLSAVDDNTQARCKVCKRLLERMPYVVKVIRRELRKENLKMQ